jgi:pSer/pThr/pTyr-binding forkhead associated (FHA) protein
MSIGGLWNRISTAFERSDIGASGEMHGRCARRGRDGAAHCDALRADPQAVERRVTTFLREDVVSHLEIGFNEVFLLHYIEIAADSQGGPSWSSSSDEFSPQARVHWVQKLLGPAVGKHVSVDEFLGLDKEFPAEALAETDPFEESLNQAAVPLYRVILHGRWVDAPVVAAPRRRRRGAEAARLAGPGIRLSVRMPNRPAARAVAEIEQFPAVLGSSVHADVEISGYYVSARHCTLHWEGERLWLADHSTNGTWVDGERVQRGARIAIANGALIGFGRDRGDAEYERYPALCAHLLRKPVAVGASATPVAPSVSTPVAPGVPASIPAHVAENAPLAVLAIADATGSPIRDVLKLPFTIGRGSAQDYVVPDANQGVSREHLVIEEINRSGAGDDQQGGQPQRHVRRQSAAAGAVRLALRAGDRARREMGRCTAGASIVAARSRRRHEPWHSGARARRSRRTCRRAGHGGGRAALPPRTPPRREAGTNATRTRAATRLLRTVRILRCRRRRRRRRAWEIASSVLLSHCAEAPKETIRDPNRLVDWVIRADAKVAEAIARRTDRAGAATLAAAWFPNQGTAHLVNVGDCRVYRLSPRKQRYAIQRVTQDQTYARFAEAPPPNGKPNDPARMVGAGAIGVPEVVKTGNPRARAAAALLGRCAQVRRRRADRERRFRRPVRRPLVGEDLRCIGACGEEQWQQG